MLRAKRSDVDCGSKICFLTHSVAENCYVYMPSNNSDCDIPCKLKGCKTELHHFIDCPIWRCFDVITTTAVPLITTTTSPMTTKPTTTPKPTTTAITEISSTTAVTDTPSTLSPLPPLDHPGYLYSSIALNILLFLILWSIVIQKCKKCIGRRIRRFRNRRNSQTSQASENAPIIRSEAARQQARSSRSNARAAPARRNSDFRAFTSSSEEFDTRENAPLLSPMFGSRRPIVPSARVASSPRVPSFLNSPVLPSGNSNPTPSSLTRAILGLENDGFRTSTLGRQETNRSRTRARGSSLFDSDQRARSASMTTFKPNPRTRDDTSWRTDLTQDTRV